MSLTTVLIFLCGAGCLLGVSLPQRLRWIGLLIASYAFVCLWSVFAAVILALSTLGTQAAVWGISHRVRQRSWILVIGIGFNLILLGSFKFASQLIILIPPYAALSRAGNQISVIFPLGISFYTFKAIATLVDTYRGKLSTEYHPGIFATYMAFLPQIAAGPIDRPDSLLPQIKSPPRVMPEHLIRGFRRILVGAIKKLIIAERLAIFIPLILDHPSEQPGPVLVLGIVMYAWYLYADFSGYSDIAIGAAQMFGITSAENFQQPYFAQSVREFWQRWHMSLSAWIREYLFFPLARWWKERMGGSFPRLTQTITNVLVMALVGLWHGNTLTFVVWGALHGIYLSVESLLNIRPVKPSSLSPAGRMLTAWVRAMLVFGAVSLAWIFFRSPSFEVAFAVLGGLLKGWSAIPVLPAPYGPDGGTALSVAVACMALMVGLDALEQTRRFDDVMEVIPRIGRWIVYASLLLMLLALGSTSPQGFIYARF
jgi:D-alanyl-lipoteichoic acid acyltransferase DltB (MBOAT superfamily)